MILLREIQEEHRAWSSKNFKSRKALSRRRFMNDAAVDAVLGICEESGELAHAVLKFRQGIRGSSTKHLTEAQDAIGDLMIFAISTCNEMGWNIEHILENTWSRVKARNWEDNAENGGDPS